MYHLIAKDKVAEQHILGKYSAIVTAIVLELQWIYSTVRLLKYLLLSYLIYSSSETLLCDSLSKTR